LPSNGPALPPAAAAAAADDDDDDDDDDDEEEEDEDDEEGFDEANAFEWRVPRRAAPTDTW
jgi:ribosomal protein L12E/L44/L45/RPP1/RPP2